jgi:hypothetical protein
MTKTKKKREKKESSPGWRASSTFPLPAGLHVIVQSVCHCCTVQRCHKTEFGPLALDVCHFFCSWAAKYKRCLALFPLSLFFSFIHIKTNISRNPIHPLTSPPPLPSQNATIDHEPDPCCNTPPTSSLFTFNMFDLIKPWFGNTCVDWFSWSCCSTSNPFQESFMPRWVFVSPLFNCIRFVMVKGSGSNLRTPALSGSAFGSMIWI